MTKRVITIAYHFVLELMAGYLLLFLYYIGKNKFPPILPLTLLGLTGIILYSWMLGSLFNKGKWIYLAIVLPLLIFAGYKAGLTVSLTVVVGLYIFWRGISLSENYPGGSHSLLLFWSFSIGIIAMVYSSMAGYIYQNQMIIMLILLVILTLSGSYFVKWNSLGTDKTKFSVFFLKILLSLSGIGIILAFTLKYIQFLFFGFFQLLAKVITGFAMPIFRFIEYLLSLRGNKNHNIKYEPAEPLQGGNDFQPHSYSFVENIMYFFVLLAVVAFIFYLIKRKAKLQSVTFNSLHAVEITDGISDQNPTWFHKKRGKPPEDFIRREIFQLERYADKLKMGRLPNETLEEWVHREGLPLSDDSLQIYYSVRYGGEIVSSKDINLVKSETETVKMQLKERKKHRKNKFKTDT